MASNNEAEGGFDFEVVGGAAKELQCPICHLLLRNATELPCHHAACKICLKKWEKQRKEWDNKAPLLCTLCNSVYQIHQVRESKVLDRLITTSLDIKCQQYEDGCPWIGKIDNYQVHERKCLYAVIRCQFGECQDKVSRKDIRIHSLECSYRTVKCKHCSQEGWFCILENHYVICPSFIIPCTNSGCTDTMMRKELDDHVNIHCEYQMICCEYQQAGCDVVVQRNQNNIHDEEFNKKHTSMILKMTMQQNYRLERAENKIRELEEDLETKTHRIIDLENSLEATQNSLETANFANQRTAGIEEQMRKSNIGFQIPIIPQLGNQRFQIAQPNISEDSAQKAAIAMSLNRYTKTFELLLQQLKINQAPNKINYSTNFRKLCNFMVTDRSHINDKELYVKVHIKNEWIRKILYVNLVDEDVFQEMKSQPLCRYNSSGVCINVNASLIFVFLQRKGRTIGNTKGWLLHPQRNEQMNDDGNKQHWLHLNNFSQHLICDSHIIIKMI